MEFTAWLIEIMIGSHPVWYRMERESPLGNWTTDAFLACHFDTEQEAKDFWNTLDLSKHQSVKFTEHGFY